MDAVQTRQARTSLIDVRPLTRAEVETVEQLLPRYVGRHRARLKLQQRGHGAYLIAWLGSRPAGHVNVRLGGRKLSGRAQRAGAAEIEDLGVSERYRRRGIATELMRRAQDEAGRRGFRALGLAVALDNEPARKLYEQEGYAESGYGTFTVSYPYLDGGGGERIAHETCTYLVKPIA